MKFMVSPVAEQYLPLATVDDPAFRSMIETWNPKASKPHRKGILRKMSEMRALMEHEFKAGQTFLGVSYHCVGADWELHAMCVDCKLLEGSTVGEKLALKIPKHTASGRWLVATRLHRLRASHVQNGQDGEKISWA